MAVNDFGDNNSKCASYVFPVLFCFHFFLQYWVEQEKKLKLTAWVKILLIINTWHIIHDGFWSPSVYMSEITWKYNSEFNLELIHAEIKYG